MAQFTMKMRRSTLGFALGVVLILMLGTAFAWVAVSRNDDAPAEAGNSPSAPQTAAQATATEEGSGECMRPDMADRTDAQSVAKTFAGIAYCWDAEQDKTPVDAVMRARDLMAPELVSAYESAQLRNPYQAQWSAAQKIQGRTVPEVAMTGTDAGHQHGADGDHPEHAEDTAEEAVSVSWQWEGTDGQTAPGGSTQLLVTLKKTGNDWEVTGYRPTSIEDGTW